MGELMGIINNTKNGNLLKEITENRYIASVPFGGRYRMIDFVLSNMVNSGIKNVGILVLGKYRSLMDHLRSGKEWGLATKRDGLFILPPPYYDGIRKGDLENFHYNFEYLRKSKQKYVVISRSNLVCNINYTHPLKFHKESDADITVLYTDEDLSKEDFSSSTILHLVSDGRITDMEVGPHKPKTNKVSMDTYIMEKNFLMDIIDETLAKGGYDFLMDCVVKNLSRLKVYGYCHQGYVGRIHSVQSYYRHNMALLNPNIWEEIFIKSGPIYTKVKDQAPVKYMENAEVKNSLIANGCVIEGTVENCILFRGVRIHKGARIKDSILMQNCEVQEGAALESVILDKEVLVSKGQRLSGSKEYPMIVQKKTMI
ncbi:glucose-1-phosphate adenylyltransferase subunit GlgD [Thermotalea metallivorans]|uniref:Glycogen biosynthesis protein GlgD n=1 Tax=Thermotalea metallivorans TaxID=520762 RepID=A0A140L3Z3_9FIRM|nr:glucose-1-phosphate adenylyltransferase subunit GlgD [Thermotalea metallivorans]KXG75268.1 Glycogen biosynthesis protein GlgD [Thermotalea metallivorans]